MDDYTNLICYIGTTKTGAGIFLSDKIIGRKKFANHLRTETFRTFDEAESEFFSRYEDRIDRKNFRINKLYKIKEDSLYSVFFSAEYVGITYADNCYETADKVLGFELAMPYWRHNLPYEKAILYLRSHFVNWYKDERLYINTAVCLHQPIMLADVKRTNKVN